MSGPVGTAPEETVAAVAMRAALAVLHACGYEDDRAALPLRLEVVRAPEPAPRADRVLPKAAPGAPSGRLALPSSAPTVREALRLMAVGSLTSRELVESSLAAAATFGDLGAVVAIDEEAVLAEADALDAERRLGRTRGPLHGVPVTVKDVIDVAGLPTRAGSTAYEGLPTHDAAAVARLREAGALVLAKVATHEFALGVATPQCANPHDPSRLAGGSSGGSAIAVATGIGLASLGTDTRASLRVPAALCGVVGFKGTFGAVPTEGIVPLGWSVDHVGPITRDAADAALVFEVLTGAPLGVPARGGPLVVGVVREAFADADAAVAAVCEEALRVLTAAGCTLVGLETPSATELELANDLGLIVSRAEAACYHRGRSTAVEQCIPEVREQLEAARAISALDYLDAQRHRRALAARVVECFGACDLVAMPTTPLVAPPRDDYERYLLRLSRNTIVWSLAGCPAATVPCGAVGSLPVGLQLAARPGGEATIVAGARLFEAGAKGRFS